MSVPEGARKEPVWPSIEITHTRSRTRTHSITVIAEVSNGGNQVLLNKSSLYVMTGGSQAAQKTAAAAASVLSASAENLTRFQQPFRGGMAGFPPLHVLFLFIYLCGGRRRLPQAKEKVMS